MFSNALHLLKENQDCLRILRAYAVREKQPGNESDSCWTKRLFDQHACADEIEVEAEAEKSSESHGLLIAYGYLDIELSGRSDGIHYRLSSDGKKALVLMEKREVDPSENIDQRLAG
ncbi:MAG: hypothetical protein JKY95_11075 [Planctomycetaceae bacterium]|nr:hypothetical protein [Planctomycetaceae bacterium]